MPMRRKHDAVALYSQADVIKMSCHETRIGSFLTLQITYYSKSCTLVRQIEHVHSREVCPLSALNHLSCSCKITTIDYCYNGSFTNILYSIERKTIHTNCIALKHIAILTLNTSFSFINISTMKASHGHPMNIF